MIGTEPDWEFIETAFRAGKTLRAIAEQHNEANPEATVGYVTISTRAKKFGWVRDLKSKIRSNAETLLQRAGMDEASDEQVIKANAQRVAEVRGSHRVEIARARAMLCDAFDRLERGNPKLPSRASIIRSLTASMVQLINLERAAWNIDDAPEDDSGSGPVDRRELARRVAFALTREHIDRMKAKAQESVDAE